jgi:hypothetical protein
MHGNDLIRFCDEMDAKLTAIAVQAREASERAHQALRLIDEVQRAVAEVRHKAFATSTTQVIMLPKEGQ